MSDMQVKTLLSQMERVLFGKEQQCRLAVAALLAGGHLLIEDVPGVGKTTLALALARSVDLRFGRIQFTPDTLPGDVTGYGTVDIQTRIPVDFCRRTGLRKTRRRYPDAGRLL